MRFEELDSSRLPRNSKGSTWLEVTSRPDGSAWSLPFLYVTGKQSGPTLTVVAGVHGDEYEGIEAIPHVFCALDPNQLCGTLLMVPVCNMPAYEAGTRSSPIDGLNLARVLPGKPDGSITERIGYWVTEKLMMPADLFIDLHSGGVALNIATSVYYCQIDSEQGRRTYEAAEVFGAPVLSGADASRAVWGCSFRTTWDRGIPGIFTEGPGGGRTRYEDVHCYAQGVINVMKHLKMIDGQPEPPTTTHHLRSDNKPRGGYTASVAGYFRTEVAILEHVGLGHRLGVVQDFGGAVLQELVAQREGFVTTLRAVPRVNAGDALISIVNGERIR